MPVPQTVFAFVTIAMALVAQVAAELASRGIAADNNAPVFAAYERSLGR